MQFESTVVTSRQNPVILRAVRLGQKKYRDAEGAFLLHGVKLTEEALAHGAEIELVLVREDSAARMEFACKDMVFSSRCRFLLVGDSAFEKISPEKSPEGIICVAKTLDKFHKSVTIKKGNSFAAGDCRGRLLLLESLRDPGNLGTILRSAAAFGVDCVLMSSDCAELYNPRTLRAAMGAIFKLPTLRVDDLPAAVAALRQTGRRVWATALARDAQQLDRLTLSPQDCFLIGNEGHGLSEAAIAAADGAVFIPICLHTESLNAAAAASICLWEQARRFGTE
ncbi:MAG: RNA methyltransferase [Clostridia bacterium]|nr:RNA methyltransferase [Clostridia bacterium]